MSCVLDMPSRKLARILRYFRKMGKGMKVTCNVENPSTVVLSSCDVNGNNLGRNYNVCNELFEHSPQSGHGIQIFDSLVQVFSLE